ncbi:methionine gamma-lyase family protein, partial [Paenibacillus polymyxa]
MVVFSPEIQQIQEMVEQKIQERIRQLDQIVDANQWKVIQSFQRKQVSDFHFAGS